jgi:cell wall-associated NlpC family hydrolase
MSKSAVIAGLTLLLCACATAPGPKSTKPVSTPITASPGTGSAAGSGPGSAIAAGAMAMLGQPYRYGGSAPGGFDCSGLVVYAAGNAGLELPRTTAEQLLAGTPVTRAQLQAGDLVFMHLRGKQLHVGIAIDAARFVHAPATGKRVRIDSLDSPTYARGYLSARRMSAAAMRSAAVQSP